MMQRIEGNLAFFPQIMGKSRAEGGQKRVGEIIRDIFEVRKSEIVSSKIHIQGELIARS